MEIWPFPFNIGRKAFRGTNAATRTERDALSEYNTDSGVAGTSFSFEVHGTTQSARQSSTYAYIAVSVNTASWQLSFDAAKSSAHADQFVQRDPATGNITYTNTRTIPRTQRATNQHGTSILYDLVELRGGDSLEINLLLQSLDTTTPTLYYAFFTGDRLMNFNQFRDIQETYLDPGLVIQRSLYGQISKQRMPHARRKWRTTYEVMIDANSPVTFARWFNFLESRLQSDKFLFSEDFARYPARVYPAITTNTEEAIRYLSAAKNVYAFPLQIEEL